MMIIPNWITPVSRPEPKAEQTFFEKRAAEKQRSRDEDARSMRTGEKTREQLRRENGAFAFPNAVIHLDACKKLG